MKLILSFPLFLFLTCFILKFIFLFEIQGWVGVSASFNPTPLYIHHCKQIKTQAESILHNREIISNVQRKSKFRF